MITPPFSRQLAIAYRERVWLLGAFIGFGVAGPQHSYTAVAGLVGALVGLALSCLRARVVTVSRSGGDLVVQNFWKRQVVPVAGEAALELTTAPLRGPWFPRFVTADGTLVKVQAITLPRDSSLAATRLIEAGALLQVTARP